MRCADDARMKLASRDGASFDLHPVQYQFSRRALDEWDRNWLMVRGAARTTGGATWSFIDPCLTTCEAAELGNWLQAAGRGEIAPSPVPVDEGGEGLLTFTEPSLAFSLAAHHADEACLRVHLSLEAAPPWAGQEGRLEVYAYYLLLRLRPTGPITASQDWLRDLQPFPIR